MEHSVATTLAWRASVERVTQSNMRALASVTSWAKYEFRHQLKQSAPSSSAPHQFTVTSPRLVSNACQD